MTTRNLCLILGCFCFSFTINVSGQVFSVSSGDWSEPSVWNTGVPPDFNNDLITISSNTEVTVSSTIEADQLVVAGDALLRILSGGRLIIKDGSSDDLLQESANPPVTQNDGLIEVENGGVLENQGQIFSIGTSTIFKDGAEYQHNMSGGFIPDATWQTGSACRIIGWQGNSASSGFLSSLGQSFHHFIWDSPNQTAANVIFAGGLTTVNGDLIISNTNSGALSNRRITIGFTTSGSSTLTIGNNLIISGTSKVSFTSAGTFTINIGGNLELSSTSSDPSGVQYQLTSAGTATLNVAKDFIINSGQFHFTAASGTGNLNLGGDFQLNGGSIHNTGGGAGNVLFTGSGMHTLTVGSGSFSANQPITYTIAANDTLDLGTYAIGNSLSDPGSSGTFVNNGTVIVASTDPAGATAGNIQIDTKTFNSGSKIIYSGASAQFIGATHPSAAGVTTIIDNANGVSLVSPTTLGHLTVKTGSFLDMTADLSVSGNIEFETGSSIIPNTSTLILTGGTGQTVDIPEATLYNLTVNKSGGADATLLSPLNLTGTLSVASANSALISNGFLRLISTSDSNTGNARVAPLLNGASVDGDVTVERFMSSEGNIYRYIASPVSSASVAQLQDDFPVTGTFPQTSGCTGCSSLPSLFYYNGSTGQYVAHPATSNTEQLVPGRGYAAFIYQLALPGDVTWDVTGPINQGPIALPVSYNSSLVESWNLVGNPYPSTINWDAPGGWVKTNVSSSIAVMDNPSGGFRYWNGGAGSGVDGGLVNGEIATGQAFWIEALAASPVLNINEQAKTTATGSFYRDYELNTLGITVSRGNVNDKTVIQLHPQASAEFDPLDATKMVNARFDLSTKLNETARLAINARNEINCGDEIPLDMRFTKSNNGTYVLNPIGNYVMSFETVGSRFEGFDLVLVDNFLDKQVHVGNGFTYEFSITSDEASFATDRFKIIFNGNPGPDTNLELGKSLAAVCEDKEVEIIIHGAESGNAYYLVKDGTVLPELREGNNDDLVFKLPGSVFNNGENTINVGVKGVCNTMLTSSLVVQKDIIKTPELIADKRCREGQLELHASGGGENASYHWYENITSEEAIFVGESYVTPVLEKTKTYYVSSVHIGGCESSREPVIAEIVNFDDAAITIEENNLLVSNYTEGNQWLYNGQQIEGATGQSINADKSGTYSVVVSVNGCVTHADIEHVVTAIEGESATIGIKVYPNPVSKELFIDFSANEVKSAWLTNSQGMRVIDIPIIDQDQNRLGNIDVSNLPGGMYIVGVELRNSRRLNFKVLIKK